MDLSQFSPKTERRRHRLVYTWFSQFLICYLLSSPVASQSQSGEQFPVIHQCKSETLDLKTKDLHLCLELGGGLLVEYPPNPICPRPDDGVVIKGLRLLTPKEFASGCHSEDINGIAYHNWVNSSCLQTHGYSERVKQVALPLIRMYSGLTSAQVRDTDRMTYSKNLGRGGQQLSKYTWMGPLTDCLDRKSTTRVLISDICAQTEQTGAKKVHIEFIPGGGAYVNQSSCSCNVVSSDSSRDSQVRTLTARAVDIRLQGSTTKLQLIGKRTSRVLDDSEILYWDADGDLLTSPEQIFVKLDGLQQERLPERMWLDVSGSNLTVRCGPANVPGGHQQPLAAESSSLGIGYIIAIIAGVVILALLLLVAIKCLYQRKRRQGSKKDMDDEYDISMGSREDIRDRVKLHALRQQVSTDSGVQPAVEVKTEAEVMCSNPRLASPRVTGADETQKALLHDRDDEEDDNGNNNTNAKKVAGTPPPPSHDPHDHEYLICRQLSYIDEDEAALPPPPPLTEDIYNHLNEQPRPDVVPGNIYDTSPEQESMYSTTTPQKKRGIQSPLPGDNYVT